MRQRIRCPFHSDATASLVNYGVGWFCFGACGKRYTNEEVQSRTGETYECTSEEFDDQENLEETFQYIDSLPSKEIRGLRFPCDERGYYVVWPDKSYYKYRLFNPGKRGKYLSPKGHRAALLWVNRKYSSTLLIIEGEINALSAAQAMPEWDVCSPGSASMFNDANLSKYLTSFKEYSNVVVNLDNDSSGIEGLIEAKAFFLYKVPFIRFTQLDPDCNEVLVKEGRGTLRAKLQGPNSK